MPINASLFAHIHNDSELKGTFQLQGHDFFSCLRYLNQFLEMQNHKGKLVSEKHQSVLPPLLKLEITELQLKSSPDHLQDIATKVVDDLQHLMPENFLFLSGLFFKHCIIYQFTRDSTGYYLTVINAGAGLNFHETSSSKEKDLFNPTKKWFIPISEDKKDKKELIYFIQRLLETRYLSPCPNIETLYKHILPSLHYLKGKEFDTKESISIDYFTASQLSGTCAQRGLHQLLKINSSSLQEYQQLILEFKLHSLREYIHVCRLQEEPFHRAVAKQMLLAIRNALRIIHQPHLFSQQEKESYFTEITSLKKDVLELKDALVATAPKPLIYSEYAHLSLSNIPLKAPNIHLEMPHYSTKLSLQDTVEEDCILLQLEKSIQCIKLLADPQVQYVYLEQLILSLPINESIDKINPQYLKTIQTDTQWLNFLEHINTLQDLLEKIKSQWFPQSKSPLFNLLMLKVFFLQIDATHACRDQSIPAFIPLLTYLIQTIISNHHRNPYIATNNPIADEQFQLLIKTRLAGYGYTSSFQYPTFPQLANYFRALLQKELTLYNELETIYYQKHSPPSGEIHEFIQNNKIGALYLIATSSLSDKFSPLTERIKQHLQFECRISRITQLFTHSAVLPVKPEISIQNRIGAGVEIITPSSLIKPRGKLSKAISKDKYSMSSTPPQKALLLDFPEEFSRTKLVPHSSNAIQLSRIKKKGTIILEKEVISEETFIARNFYHLRAVPELQIALTLDYFTNHLSLLSEPDNQRYLEANLFQPGLLKVALQTPGFFTQFDRLLTEGTLIFTKDARPTTNTLIFFRLDLLVSIYYLKMSLSEGKNRLKTVYDRIMAQLSLANNDHVHYVLQEYLFLAVATLLEQEDSDATLLQQALISFFYINNHENPFLLNDNVHQIEVDTAKARFKILLQKQSQTPKFISNIENAIRHIDNSIQTIKHNFPLLTAVTSSQKTYEIDLFQGKFFEGRRHRTTLPLVIWQHPLIEHLGLEKERIGLCNPTMTSILIEHSTGNVELFYKPLNEPEETLIVRKEWTLDANKQWYELHALSDKHQAYLAASTTLILEHELPAILTDGSMNYWCNVNAPQSGLLTKNNVPLYYVCPEGIYLIHEGQITQTQLMRLTPAESHLLNRFESNDFILVYQNLNERTIELPRFDLQFKVEQQETNTIKIFHATTQEVLVTHPSSLDHSAPGLYLRKEEQVRLLVPKARFYESRENAVQGEFYPVIHDRNNTIAEKELKDLKADSLQWHYTNSEKYASYSLQNNEIIPDTLHDALYQAYIYLVTNQTAKAWNTLDVCSKQFGGLSGTLKELQCIQWLFKALPFCFDDDDAIRENPATVACQLKALYLVIDYLRQGRTFQFPPCNEKVLTANDYLLRNYQEKTYIFLQALKNKTFSVFKNLQRMRRHQSSRYHLSEVERRCLLDYCANGLSIGAVAYETTRLTMKSLRAEMRALSSAQTSPTASLKKKVHLEKQFSTLSPVYSYFTSKDNEIDLSFTNTLATEIYSKAILVMQAEPPSPSLTEEMPSISFSSLTEEELRNNFSVYLRLALNRNPKLYHFCLQTLLTHQDLTKKELSLRFFLCNILYRIHHRPETLSLTEIKTLSDLMIHEPPPILIPRPQRSITILASPENIIDIHKPKTVCPVLLYEVPQEGLIIQTGLQPLLAATILDLISDYRQEDQSHLIRLQQYNASSDCFFDTTAEQSAGQDLFQTLQNKKAIAQRLLSNEQLLQNLQEALKKVLGPLIKHQESFWEKAYRLANKGPEEKQRAFDWALELEASIRTPLTQQHLLSLYIQGNLNTTQKQTGLNAEEATTLHHLIHQSLINGILHQCVLRMLAQLELAIKTDEHEKKLQHICTAFDLLARHEIPGQNTPAIVLLQHEEQILLHPRQISALFELLKPGKEGVGFHSVVEKIIMGGGKSKVMLPILVENKAQGDNLLVIEVPQALLKTNYEDLNRSTQRLFGKRAYCFEFNRDSQNSAERLKEIYYLFMEVMTQKAYLITTGESMMALELSYLELLLKPLKELEEVEKEEIEQETEETLEMDAQVEWQQQLYWLEKTLELLRQQGDCIIDEVHLGLSIKKQLNYVGEDKKPINKQEIKNTIQLYRLVQKFFPDILQEAQTYAPDFDWRPFQTTLVHHLLTSDLSLIKPFVDQALKIHGPEAKTELLNYLTEQASTLSPVITEATAKEQQTLAFLKQQINVLLPYTLSRHINEHYGASKRHNISALQKTLALPYAGNNIVNERNRFGNVLETLNYSTQMLYLQGISKDLLIETLQKYLREAQNELLLEPMYQTVENTPTAQGFFHLTQLSLSQFNATDTEQINAWHERLCMHQDFIERLLKKYVLPQIEHDQEVLSANALNHVSLYRSLQGLSGTPYNATTFHQQIAYDKSTSLGTDGFVITLIERKEPSIKALDYTLDLRSYIHNLLTQSSNVALTRTIIDICATFKGQSNLLVAQEIALFYQQAPSSIEYVVYFNEEQQLCAINIHRIEQVIVLKSTNPQEITRRLNATADKRFTYYDQTHTVGTDIQQADKAHALILVDKSTSLQSFLQGSMRMRGLALEQTVEIITPQWLQNTSFKALIAQFSQNDRQQLEHDNLAAAKLKMANVLRNHCLQIILELPTEEVQYKSQIAHIFKAQGLLIHKANTDLYTLYGSLSQEQSTPNILHTYKQQLIICWEKCKSALLGRGIEAVPEITSELETIIENSLPYCLENYVGAHQLEKTEVEIQTQKEVKKEIQKEVQKEIVQEIYNRSLIDASLMPCYSIENYFFSSKDYSLTLNQFFQDFKDKPCSIFTETLRVSSNYALTYIDQEIYLNPYLKPVHLVWYHYFQSTLHATIITPEEFEEYVKKLIPDDENSLSWVTTTLDTLIMGNRPANILENPHYLSYQEQVRFFNAEFSSLSRQDTPLIWLTLQTEEKISFFANLEPYRPKSAGDIFLLKESLLQTNSQGFNKVIQNPATHGWDLSSWEQDLGQTLSRNAFKEYKHLIKAIQYLNQQWDKDILSFADLKRRYNLPLSSLSFVDKYYKLTKTLALLNKKLDAESLDLLRDANRCLQVILETPSAKPRIAKQPPQEFLQELFNICLHPVINGGHPIQGQLIQEVLLHPWPSEKFLPILGLRIAQKASIKQSIIKKLCQEESLPDEVISKLLKEELTTEQLRSLLQKTFDQEHIQLILNHPKADQQLKTDVLTHCFHLKENTDEFLEMFLSMDLTYTAEQIAILTEHIQQPRHIQALLVRLEKDRDFFTLSDKSMHTLLLKEELTTEQLRSLLQKTFNQEHIQLILNHPKADQQLITDVLTHCFKLKENINGFVKMFLSMDLTFTAEQLTILTEHITQPHQIQTLARLEINSTNADALFQKSSFNHVIQNWSWLTENQLESIIKKTLDYNSFKIALNHKNLSPSARQRIIHGLERQQTLITKQAKTPEEHIFAEIKSLVLLACKQMIKGTDNPKYLEAAEATFTLYQALHQASERFFIQKTLTPEAYQKLCKENFTEALKILGNHRGIKQKIYDIFNKIFAFICNTPTNKDNHWRFFEANTASMNKVNRISDKIIRYSQVKS